MVWRLRLIYGLEAVTLLGELRNLIRLRLLSAVGGLRTGVDLELSDQPAAELVFGQHPPYGKLDGLARISIQQLAVRHRLETSRAARVPTRQTRGALCS